METRPNPTNTQDRTTSKKISRTTLLWTILIFLIVVILILTILLIHKQNQVTKQENARKASLTETYEIPVDTGVFEIVNSRGTTELHAPDMEGLRLSNLSQNLDTYHKTNIIFGYPKNKAPDGHWQSAQVIILEPDGKWHYYPDFLQVDNNGKFKDPMKNRVVTGDVKFDDDTILHVKQGIATGYAIGPAEYEW